MKLFFISLVAVLIIYVGFLVGTKKTSSYENRISQTESILDADKDFEVEYASTINKMFYQKMVEMERNSTLILMGFPLV